MFSMSRKYRWLWHCIITRLVDTWSKLLHSWGIGVIHLCIPSFAHHCTPSIMIIVDNTNFNPYWKANFSLAGCLRSSFYMHWYKAQVLIFGYYILKKWYSSSTLDLSLTANDCWISGMAMLHDFWAMTDFACDKRSLTLWFAESNV